MRPKKDPILIASGVVIEGIFKILLSKLTSVLLFLATARVTDPTVLRDFLSEANSMTSLSVSMLTS